MFNKNNNYSMNDIRLLHINEIPFKLDLDIPSLTDDLKKRIQVAFLFVLQYQEGNSASALHSVVKFMLDGQTILEGGVTLIFQSKKWEEMPHVEEEVKQSSFARDLIAYSYPFMSGVQFSQIKGTKLDGMFLPMINPDELVKDLHVEEVKK